MVFADCIADRRLRIGNGEPVRLSVSLEKLEKALWKKDGKAREMLLKTCPDRLHTIYPGMLILDELVQLSQCETIYISKYGVREGYLRRELARKKKTIEPEK